MTKFSIFLAGTDDVRYVIEYIEEKLSKMGLEPYWFHRKIKVLEKDTMKTCLDNVKKCDRFILILNRRSGLPYESSEKYPDDSYRYTITREEFNTANKGKKPILIFINYEIYIQSKIYHKEKKEKKRNLNKEEFDNLNLKGDMGLFEFIEDLQHLKRNGEKEIKWIEPYNYSREIVEQIQLKWDLKKVIVKSEDDVINKQTKAFFNKLASFLRNISIGKLSTRIIMSISKELKSLEEKNYFGIEIAITNRGSHITFSLIDNKYRLDILCQLEANYFRLIKNGSQINIRNFKEILNILNDLCEYIQLNYGIIVAIPNKYPNINIEVSVKEKPLLFVMDNLGTRTMEPEKQMNYQIYNLSNMIVIIKSIGLYSNEKKVFENSLNIKLNEKESINETIDVKKIFREKSISKSVLLYLIVKLESGESFYSEPFSI